MRGMKGVLAGGMKDDERQIREDTRRRGSNLNEASN